MKKITFIFFLLFGFQVIAQDTQQLIGKWKYEDIYEKDKLDAKSQNMLQQFFADMLFEFKPSDVYQATLMGKVENGSWKIVKNQITLTNEKGQANQLEIVNFTGTLLTVKYGKSTFILKKV